MKMRNNLIKARQFVTNSTGEMNMMMRVRMFVFRIRMRLTGCTGSIIYHSVYIYDFVDQSFFNQSVKYTVNRHTIAKTIQRNLNAWLRKCNRRFIDEGQDSFSCLGVSGNFHSPNWNVKVQYVIIY